MPTADVLNRHYAFISTDPAYVPVQRKHSAGGAESHCTEYDVFHMLDRLKPTATGMDGLPAWFLRVSAPVIAAPLAVLFNQSILSGASCAATVEDRCYHPRTKKFCARHARRLPTNIHHISSVATS